MELFLCQNQMSKNLEILVRNLEEYSIHKVEVEITVQV